MPLRDLALSFIILGLLPVCLLRPWIGALAWAWIGYMNPHRLTWGFALNAQFAMMVAVATLVGFALTRDRKPFLWTRETVLFVALWGWFAVTTLTAEHPDWAWEKFAQVSKVLLMALITVPLFQDRHRLRWLLLVIATSLGFYGAKGGIFSLAHGGAHKVFGPSGSFIAGNNDIGLALNMALPMLVYLAREEPRRWLRAGLLVTAGLTMVAIPFTYSRGAVLGLAVVLGMLFLKARYRLLLVPIVGVALLVFMSYTPEQWTQRMETMTRMEVDSSVEGRLAAWRVAYRLALDSPLTGGGFGVFFDGNTYLRYGETPSRGGGGRNAHSLYFNLLGEHGWVGLGLFAAMMVSTLLTLRGVRKDAARSPGLSWAGNYARMLEISFLAYLTNGAFISVAYFDLMYQLILITVVLRRVAVEAPAATMPPVPVPSTAAARRVLATGSR